MPIHRRSFLKRFAAIGAAATPLGRASMASSGSASASAAEVVADSVVIDALSYLHRNPDLKGADHSTLDLGMLADSGVTVVSPTADTRDKDPDRAFHGAVRRLAELTSTVARHRDQVSFIRTGSEIEVAKVKGRQGVLPNFQGTTAIGTDLNNLEVFHGLGVRQIQLTYNWRNLVGNGCLERVDGGLTRFGLEVVKKMNEMGIVVDVGHSGYRTTLDAVEVSTKPILYSHSNCKALYDHPRNKSDEQIKALARKGGVMGMTILSWFVSEKPRSTLDDLLDHFDHAIQLVGPDHVGIGSDMGLPGWPVTEPDQIWEAVKKGYSTQDWNLVRPKYPPFVEGINDEHRYIAIAGGLQKRGYSIPDIKKVLGLNFLRVYKEVLG